MSGLEPLVKILSESRFRKWDHDYNEDFPPLMRGSYLSVLMMPNQAAACGFPTLPSPSEKLHKKGQQRYKISHICLSALQQKQSVAEIFKSVDKCIIEELKVHFTVVQTMEKNIVSWYPCFEDK